MKWYRKYLAVFEKNLAEIPQSVQEEISDKLKNLISDTPLVSVVVIAHNEERRLWGCLWSLADNLCDFPVEIIGVDNLSGDHTGEIFQRSGIRFFQETQKGPGHARQCGLNQAKGKYYICIDADTLYPPRYIQTLVRQLERKGTAGVYSLWSFLPGEKYSRHKLWLYETLRDIHLKIQSFRRPELCVRGMVFGFNTDYGRQIGFRTDIIRGEDGSLALALKQYGKLKFITTRKARAITSTSTLGADGSLLQSLKVRIKKHLKNFTGYFVPKNEYKDEDSNLLPNNK
ncbi:MAG: glycosyltransferase family 2 protein [Odoribacter splanchnicus]|nr:glycosyltransferase family 2 protein [Odoribacter splanchnicus]MBD9179958.1 glycosyltransferase family 2 protein [Odoribacter splanchnicus]